MKKLGEFVLNEFENGKTTSLVTEYRTAGSKNRSTLANINPDKIDGKDADANGTGGKMAINEPIDKEADDELNAGPVDSFKEEDMDNNEWALYEKFLAEDDFFIIGRAGWGKTSIIHQFAKRFGYEVIPFYLDKCEAIDLGGMPIADKDERTGRISRVNTTPPFAEKIAANPKKKYLLFFDEMNQAAPDVQNALMPIVLEHEIAGVKYNNFFCGAAGNYRSENDAVEEMNGPLKSRFKPLIEWETNTDASWGKAIEHLRGKWQSKVGKNFMDAVDDAHTCFDNPREIEHKLIERYVARFIDLKKNLPVERWLDHLKRLCRDELSQSQKAKLEKLAEMAFNCVNNGGKDVETGGRRGRKTQEMWTKDTELYYKNAMERGYVTQYEDANGNWIDPDKVDELTKKGTKIKTVKYGISRENVYAIEDQEALNGEMLDRLIRKLENDGVKFKFEKDSEWKEKGYKDPNE